MIILKNIRLTLRSLVKNKWVTLLNVLGLTVGLSVSSLIFIFVYNQYNIDQFIPEINNVYCLTNNGESSFSKKELDHIRHEVPSMNQVTFCSEDWSPQVFLKSGENSFKTDKMLTADSCFFRVFAFDAVYGNPATALNASNKVVLTRSFARKIFGNINPVGKSVVYNSTYLEGELLEVTAVIEDFPPTSSWNFDAVLSFSTNYHIDWYADNLENWGARNYEAFVRLNGSVSNDQVLAKLQNINLEPLPDWEKEDFALGLFSYSDVYFDLPDVSLTKHGNKVTVLIIGITGLLILLLACINYINMTTAQRRKRNKNIGIVKILGGHRMEIIRMMTMESLVQVLLSGLLSFLLIELALPVFNNFLAVNASATEVLNLQKISMIAAVLVLMIAITGIIPGIIFSRKQALMVIKHQNQTNKNNLSRNGLLIVQFTVTIVLIVSVLMINKQNALIQNTDTGIEKEHIIYAFTNETLYENSDSFTDELRKIPGIAEFTFSESVLIDNSESWGKDFENKGERLNVNFSKLSVAPNFFDFFGIKLNEGRPFNDRSADNEEFILNKVAKQKFKINDLKDARMIEAEPDQGAIVGIVDNFNFESLHVPIRAAGFKCSGDFDEVIYLKLNGANKADVQNTINQFEAVWNELSPGFPLEYAYLDQKWESKYQEEAQFQQIILYTTLISILLSCMGLIGLTFFVAEQRTKEIGIRKVNGAKISEILTMLNKDFIKWVAIAFVIATPIAYYAMNSWLENFAYKTSLSWWIFALAGLLALGIALLTVSYQSWKAATRNPVEALRYE
nr:ABC transporter permease [uncultured Carboxylicivirga sp.]